MSSISRARLSLRTVSHGGASLSVLYSSLQVLQSTFDGLSIGDGRTSECTKSSSILSNTREGCHVVNVSFISIDQVSDCGAKRSVITQSCSQLIQGIKCARSRINQVRNLSSHIALSGVTREQVSRSSADISNIGYIDQVVISDTGQGGKSRKF